jgi:two-component system response regulator AtoC
VGSSKDRPSTEPRTTTVSYARASDDRRAALRDGTRQRTRVLFFWDGGSSAQWIGSDQQWIVGRSATCDVCVDDPSVSREHARLYGAGPDIEDLGSLNGVRVRGERLDAGVRTRVAPGDVVELGSAVVVFERPDVGAPSATIPPPVTTETACVTPAHRDGSMAAVERLIDVVARSDISVLLLGGTGVGKSVAAEEIHRRSSRTRAPFVRVDCAALTESLLESELFGHEKGAFTGAVQAKPGIIESADGGTVFLDEIGEAPLTTQTKLLGVLENRQVTRIGSLHPRKIDVRFIAATNRDLGAATADGTFRRDLFYRLRGLPISIPPLRERTQEIPALAARFLSEACARGGRTVPRLSEGALQMLGAHDWPGNLRELRHAMDRAALLCPGDEVLAEHVRVDGEAAATTTTTTASPGPVAARPAQGDLRRQVEDFERQRVIETLDQCAGNQTRAARVLGISRRALILRLEAYGVARPRKRPDA